MRTIPTAAKKRRPIAKIGGNQVSNIGIIIQPQNSDARRASTPDFGLPEISSRFLGYLAKLT
jgi:hypothetical protein